MHNKSIIRFSLLSLLIICAGLFIFSCSDKGSEPDPDILAGVMKSHSECGGYDETISTMVTLTYDDTLSCIDYIYSNGTLTLVHYNAGFNCCPIITGNVSFSGDTIILNEIESFGQYGGCHCLCLFDLTFEVVNLPEGEYVIAVNENYLEEGEDQIIFNIDLANDFSGSFCTSRDYYPWGVYDNPSGHINNSSDCGGFQSRGILYSEAGISDTSSCIVYTYTTGNTLYFEHTNAVLNCCPIIVADITISSNEIIIEEIDSLDNGGCDCICTYDIDYAITDLAPGSYTIKIIEPYLMPGEDTLKATVDLISDPDGIFCAIRNNLPLTQ